MKKVDVLEIIERLKKGDLTFYKEIEDSNDKQLKMLADLSKNHIYRRRSEKSLPKAIL